MEEKRYEWSEKKNCIVVPYLDLATTRRALDTAQVLKAPQGVIHVVHALLPFGEAYPAGIFLEDTSKDFEQHAFERVRDKLQEAGYNVKLHLRFGDPVEIITELCEELEADLLIMQSAQKKGLSRLFLGSVAEHMVRQAPCPMLVLHE